MPTYTYLCDGQPGHEFDVVQRITEEPLETCIHCDEPCRRLIPTGTTFVLKGEGWTPKNHRGDP